MESILFIGLFVLVFIGIPIGIGLLCYFIPKKLGYPKSSKYLTIIYGFIILTSGLYIAFEDHFFSKNDAIKLLEEQNFELTNEFYLLKNESISAIGDYYHTFTLKISDRDKQALIYKIKTANNFNSTKSPLELRIKQTDYDRYFGKNVVINYETENYFVRESFKPSGRKGHAPIIRKITIMKMNNELIFEDIIE